jgi:hypothetical protein
VIPGDRAVILGKVVCVLRRPEHHQPSVRGTCDHTPVTAADGSDGADEDAATFLQFEGMPTLSRAAFQLHSFAIINSIKDGHPGFVSDDYLNAITAETTTTALELEAAGMWQRRDGGYFIVSDEMVRMAINYGEQRDRREAECAQRSAHLPSDVDESGWVICNHCGIPLRRPDGGPVALPDGGPLGPDPRDDED